MARLSAVGAPATPDQTEESEERSSTGAGAMATSNASINAHRRDNASPGIMSSNANKMGQNESRETVRARNAALHRAPGQAIAPRPGKLPRRSGGLSHVVSGQRKLGNNVLANENTFNVPTDDAPAPIRRQAATTAQFSPLKRQILQQSREERRRQEERERQAALDWQLESARVVEDIESRRGDSRAGLSGEDAAVHQEVSESDASDIQPGANAEEPTLSTKSLFLSHRSRTIPKGSADDLESRDQMTRSKSWRATYLDGNVDDLQMQREKPKPADQLLMKSWKSRPSVQGH